MSVQTAVIANLVTRFHALACRTKLGGIAAFRHVNDGTDLEALLDESGATRRFSFRVASHASPTGSMSAISEETETEVTLEGRIAYEVTHSGTEFAGALLEDLDDLRHELMRTDGDRYNAASTKMSRRILEFGGIEYDGNYALVPFTAVCRYDAS